MHFIEVLERCRQLRKHRLCVAQVHAAEVVAPERVDETFRHAVALRAARRRGDGLQAQLLGDAFGIGSDVRAAVWRTPRRRRLRARPPAPPWLAHTLRGLSTRPSAIQHGRWASACGDSG